MVSDRIREGLGLGVGAVSPIIIGPRALIFPILSNKLTTLGALLDLRCRLL